MTIFGLFKPKPAPEGPVGFEAELDIGCSATELYAIIDFASETCWKRDVGKVEEVDPGSFRMNLDLLPEVDFNIEVLETEPKRVYAYSCVAEPLVGRLLRSIEGYQFDPTGEDSCRVTLVVVADFAEGMSKKEWQDEIELMSVGVNNSLAKLKVHAELGLEAVEAIEQAQRDAMDEAA